MESGRGHGGGIRGGPGGKKMRKRKELDALVGGVGVKRGSGGCKRPGSGGVSPQDQLLSESTGEEEYWSSAKGGNGKRRKLYSSSHGKRGTCACNALLRLCTILLVMACVVATITVMWLFIDIKEQTTYLRSQLDQVSASNDGIPESIQKCHKLTKQLEKNQTKIINQLQIVAQTLTNFSNMISGIQADLSKVEKKLDESQPQLNVHNTLQTLTSNVASFRDQIDELQSKVASISDIQAQMKTLVKSMNANVSSIHNDLQDLKKESSEKSPSEKINKESIVSLVTGNIDPEIKTVNNTLWSQVKLLSDDLHEVQKIINNLTEESAYFKTNIETIYNSLSEKNVNLNILRDEVKDYYKDWKQSIKETRDIQSNITKFWRSCSQCKYLYNEESATGISPASEILYRTEQLRDVFRRKHIAEVDSGRVLKVNFNN